MAKLIELKRGDRTYNDWSLDGDSIESNCKRLADEMARARKRPVTAMQALEATRSAIAALSRVTQSHRAVVDALRARGQHL